MSLHPRPCCGNFSSAARGLEIDSPPKAQTGKRLHLGEDGAPGLHAQGGGIGGEDGEGGARPASASSQDVKDGKKSIVSPVGQYIKTGQLPVGKVRGSTSSKVRGSTSSMGTIRESAQSLVCSPVCLSALSALLTP